MRSALRAIAAAEPLSGRGDELRTRIGDVPGDGHPWHARASAGIVPDPPVFIGLAAEGAEEGVVGAHLGADEHGGALDAGAVAQLHALEAVGVDDEAGDLPRMHADAARVETLLLVVREGAGVGEVDDIGGPLGDEERVGDRCRRAPDHPEGAITHLVAVAVRAVQHVSPPALAQTRDVGDLVAEPRADQDAPGLQPAAVVEGGREARRQLRDASVDDRASVARDLVPSAREQRGGCGAVTGEEAVQVRRGGVAGLPGIDDRDRASSTEQDQGGAEAGGTAADDEHIESLHATRVVPEVPERQTSLPLLGNTARLRTCTVTRSTRRSTAWVRGCGGCGSSGG